MKLTEERRRLTGAFYTPKAWADLAVAYLRKNVGDDYLRECMVYDPCAGEGALLDAFPSDLCYCKIGSTLEEEDCRILYEKGYGGIRFDWLRDEDMEFRLPFLRHVGLGNRLVIFTNPPFFRLPKEDEKCAAYERWGCLASNNACGLILTRLRMETCHSALATFSKIDIFQSEKQSKVGWRVLGYPYGVSDSFVCPSMSWPGLKGKFPIVFSIFPGNAGECQMRLIERAKLRRMTEGII